MAIARTLAASAPPGAFPPSKRSSKAQPSDGAQLLRRADQLRCAVEKGRRSLTKFPHRLSRGELAAGEYQRLIDRRKIARAWTAQALERLIERGLAAGHVLSIYHLNVVAALPQLTRER